MIQQWVRFYKETVLFALYVCTVHMFFSSVLIYSAFLRYSLRIIKISHKEGT